MDLTFLDSARYAIEARTFLETGNFLTLFVFPTTIQSTDIGWISTLPPVQPFLLFIFFKIFGVSDLSVILESSFFYSVSLPFIYLIGNRLYSKTVGLLAMTIYLFSAELMHFAFDGASEGVFIFEMLLIFWLIMKNSGLSLVLGGVISGLAIFTKLQSYIFLPVFLVWLISENKNSIKSLFFFIPGVILILANKLGIFFSHYTISVPLYLSLQQSSLFPGDDVSRSAVAGNFGLNVLLKYFAVFVSKVFYNMYNYYKIIFSFNNLLPTLTSPLIVVSFIFSWANFLKSEKSQVRKFEILTISLFLLSLLVASATSPQIRYIQECLPFIIIVSSGFLVRFAENFGTKARLLLILLVLLFLVLPRMGEYILDSRFVAKTNNTRQMHIYKLLGETLLSTNPKSLIMTNLDTWGSWYGHRRTMLITSDLEVFKKIDQVQKFDYLFLTDFQKDNADHPVAGFWQEVYDEKYVKYVSLHFKLQKEATISTNLNYEASDFHYKLFKRND